MTPEEARAVASQMRDGICSGCGIDTWAQKLVLHHFDSGQRLCDDCARQQAEMLEEALRMNGW